MKNIILITIAYILNIIIIFLNLFGIISLLEYIGVIDRVPEIISVLLMLTISSLFSLYISKYKIHLLKRLIFTDVLIIFLWGMYFTIDTYIFDNSILYFIVSLFGNYGVGHESEVLSEEILFGLILPTISLMTYLISFTNRKRSAKKVRD